MGEGKEWEKGLPQLPFAALRALIRGEQAQRREWRQR
jgi:hypothetical protein